MDPLLTTTDVQAMLEENYVLIKTILEQQNLGRLNEMLQYQTKLQENLIMLAKVADAQPLAPMIAPQSTSPGPPAVGAQVVLRPPGMQASTQLVPGVSRTGGQVQSVQQMHHAPLTSPTPHTPAPLQTAQTHAPGYPTLPMAQDATRAAAPQQLHPQGTPLQGYPMQTTEGTILHGRPEQWVIAGSAGEHAAQGLTPSSLPLTAAAAPQQLHMQEQVQVQQQQL